MTRYGQESRFESRPTRPRHPRLLASASLVSHSATFAAVQASQNPVPSTVAAAIAQRGQSDRVSGGPSSGPRCWPGILRLIPSRAARTADRPLGPPQRLRYRAAP
jgi:hypothetical protein